MLAVFWGSEREKVDGKKKGGDFMEMKYDKIYTSGTEVALKVAKGHFATNHAHTNYYLDLTTIKSRISEAREVAKALVQMYLYDMIVDTIVCMEGTEVIGTLLAEELTKDGFLSLNAHKTIYIIKPEFNSNSQIIFKENFRPMLDKKNVILLTATVTTGLTINKGIEGIQYYGGIVQSVSAVFSALDEMNGVPVKSVFGKKDLPDYMYSDYRNCPICKEGKKLDALINPYGYSKL